MHSADPKARASPKEKESRRARAPPRIRADRRGTMEDTRVTTTTNGPKEGARSVDEKRPVTATIKRRKLDSDYTETGVYMRPGGKQWLARTVCFGDLRQT